MVNTSERLALHEMILRERFMTAQAIADSLRPYLVDSFLQGPAKESFQDNSNLFQLLDSLQVLRMVVRLDTLFGVKVADAELSAENLGTLERVAAFTAAKMRQAESAIR